MNDEPIYNLDDDDMVFIPPYYIEIRLKEIEEKGDDEIKLRLMCMYSPDIEIKRTITVS